MTQFVSDAQYSNSGNGVINVILDGTGTNRVVIALLTTRAANNGPLLSATLDGAAGEILASSLETKGSQRTHTSAVAWLDASHPGGATAALDVQFTAASGVMARVIELSGWAQQDIAAMSADLSGALLNTAAQTLTKTVSGKAGGTVISTFEFASNSSTVNTAAHGANITTLDESENTDYLASYTGYDIDVGSASEIYTIDYTRVTGTADAAINYGVIVLDPPPGPTVTLSTDLQPGQPFTATATNFASAPVSPATITDASANSITVPVTVTDDGGGTYTVTGTMPALVDGGTSPKFGTVTLELVTA